MLAVDTILYSSPASLRHTGDRMASAGIEGEYHGLSLCGPRRDAKAER